MQQLQTHAMGTAKDICSGGRKLIPGGNRNAKGKKSTKTATTWGNTPDFSFKHL